MQSIVTKIILLLTILALFFSSSLMAETIDVNIKGVDDGVKTNRQHDYQEAVMNAKLQAIERAGASIASITKVENFQLKYDAIESQSKAILLPGFQIVDIGYVADGTYQVVLIGKIQVEEKEVKAKETRRDGRFIAYNNGTVLDTKTNLMWASKDNGAGINWYDAKSYCENYRGGGYKDWRMPTHDELASLYHACRGGEIDCGTRVLTKLINATGMGPWASETRGSEAQNFRFDVPSLQGYFPKSDAHDNINRALPVRSAK
jgi:hypothetical protein